MGKQKAASMGQKKILPVWTVVIMQDWVNIAGSKPGALSADITAFTEQEDYNVAVECTYWGIDDCVVVCSLRDDCGNM